MSLNNDRVPQKQTALVLQGGGALGAYEAGAVQAIFDKLKENENVPSFDIIAGTSIEAITASILVNHFMKNKKWDGLTSKLDEFWKDVSNITYVELNPTFRMEWDYYHGINPNAATVEAARRYYSVKELLFYGSRNISGSPAIIPDAKFLDPLNTWYLYDSKPLEDLLIRKYLTEFPLKTSLGQPRLLLVSVDIEESTAVTFDSYEKNGGVRKTEYGDYEKDFSRNGQAKKGFEHIIAYNDGLSIEHVLASSAVPIFYEYKRIEGEPLPETASGNGENKPDPRYFWDGILLSNTPLRELINQHQDFWENKIGEPALLNDMWKIGDQPSIKKVPDLDVYIIDIWPTKKDAVPSDHDESVDRMNDIMSNDKTDYDETVAMFVSDYIDFVKRMRNLAAEAISELPSSNRKKKILLENLDNTIPQMRTKSTKRTGERRLYQDLIKGRFNLNRVLRIERKEDHNTISSKWQDFSSDTISQLLKSGYSEGSFQMDIYLQIDKVRDLAKRGKLTQDEADDFVQQLIKIKRNYLTSGKEKDAEIELQEIIQNIQTIK